LKVRRPRRIIRGMDEETTHNLPQDGVERILASIGSLDARLTSLEEKVDRRLQETRPIWEQVLVRLDGFEKRLDGFGSELRTSLRRFERNIGRLAEDVLEVRAYQRDLEKRMDDLEPKTT
jgi:predicted nuclease with TOPRIM domain